MTPKKSDEIKRSPTTLSSHVLLPRRRDCAHGAWGQEPAGSTCCAGQKFTLHTKLVSKAPRETDFSQTSLAIHITAKCTPGSKYNSRLQSLPVALAHQSPKKKIGYNFTNRLLCLEKLFIFQMYINSFGPQNAPLSRNSCQE